MRTKTELIQSWIDKAEKDILTIEHELSFENAVTESICFHSQQASEKFLKAYLIFLDISFPHTHEIGELITRCAERDPDIVRWRDEADELTDYAVEVRYPDNLLEPTIEEAHAAFAMTQRIRQWVLQRIHLLSAESVPGEEAPAEHESPPEKATQPLVYATKDS